MNARVEDRVEGWSSRPFSGGHAGLRDLADEDFSGVVEARDGTWLCMLNGAVVGVFDGRMDDFEDAEGTTYVAPDPALPLLFAMWEREGTLEDQYYTQETPVSQADGTLSSGGFSGYIELSNNVLSGDYYICYYGDRSMSVAFIGSNERLVTGEDAFERADDEVGIYDVYSVDIEVVDVPAPGSDRRSEDQGRETTGADDPVDERPGAGEPVRAPGRTVGGDADAGTRESEPDPVGSTTGGQSDPNGDVGTAEDRTRRGSDARSDGPASGTPNEPSGRTDREPGTDPDASESRAGDASGEAGDGRSRREPSGRDLDAESRSGRRSSDPSEQSRTRESPGDRGTQPTAGETGSGRNDGEPRSNAGGDDRPHGEDAGGDRSREPRAADETAARSEPPADTGDRSDRRTETDPGSPTGTDGRRTSSTDTRNPSRGGDRADPEPDDPQRGEGGRRTDDQQRQDRTGAEPDDPQRGEGGRRTDDQQRQDRTGTERGGRGHGQEERDTDEQRPQTTREDVTRLQERLRDHEATIDRLRDRIAALESDRDALGDPGRLRERVDEIDGDLSQLRRTVMRLDDTVEQLRSETERRSTATDEDRSTTTDHESGPSSADRARSPDPEPASGTDPGRAGEEAGTPDPRTSVGVGLSVDEALEETTVLVRYGTQSHATLKHAHGGEADRSEVNDNLSLTAHTSFEDSTATVEGEPYREFLESRLEYRFFEWLVRELPYAVSESGNEGALSELYDAVPRIDRAEFRGTVAVEDGGEDEDGADVGFDLVARDDRDTPLVAMNFHDSRDPATEDMVVELTEGAGAAAEVGLTAAFLVTTSYFEGAARDVVEEATKGSILSRSSKKSFVRVSRRRGYHLCLAAVSDGDFHLKMPEL